MILSINNLSIAEMRRKGLVTVLYCLFTIIIASGCGNDTGDTEVSDTPVSMQGIEKEYKRGPVVFTVKASNKEITIADRLSLILEVRAAEEYEVRLPEFGEKLDQFGIADYHAPTPRLIEDGLVLYSKSYELEPFLSGEYNIPSMKVTFWKKEEGDQERHEIESDPLTIIVKSLIPEKRAGLTIEEIVPPVEFPRSSHLLLYLAILGAFIIITAIAVFIYRRRHLNIDIKETRLAHDIAYEELEKLLTDNLIDRGELKLFYLRLSNILRRYIENRFSLRAPERTTEEFLSDIRSTQVLITSHKELLKEFLVHCDMVKFAEHTPADEEIQKTFDAFRQFIAETEIKNGERLDGFSDGDIKNEI